MNVAVSPMASEASSPMITSVTPTLEPGLDKHDDPDLCGPSVSGDGPTQKQDPYRRYQKPPPLHTGADWKVVLHLPEIETWLRTTTERVRDLTHSVQQDSINRHVDVHLVQLKDICEDISDHVEQIHALLETEFSLKLLSYSVNIIVDIRSVQLLWHQLRVSVLVLKERLLQGLQDSNGNYTRQTDILQAFSQDHDEARLDALTEVDDSGQLTIKCSKDYFSLDCGITAYELSDYSPIEDAEGQGPRSLYPELEQDFPELLQSVDLLNIAASRQNQVSSSPAEAPVTSTQEPQETISGPTEEESTPDSAMQGDSSFALSKRPLQGAIRSDVSPTQPLPKKPMYLEGDGNTRFSRPSPLQYQADLSRSTPSLLDTPDRSKFWLELESVYPGNGSQSYESLHAMNGRNLRMGLKRPSVPGEVPLERRSSEAVQGLQTQKHLTNVKTMHSKAKQAYSDSSSPPPSSGEEVSDHDAREMSSSPGDQAPTTGSLWIVNQNALQISNASDSPKEHWYGSDEFLALPAQLKKTEMLAMKLENLAQALPQRGLQESIQDVDDWELSEVNPDWESSSDLLLLHPYKKFSRAGRFSPTSSSDVAPSLDDSIESGPLSDLLSEDEGARSTPESRGRNISTGRPIAPKIMFQCTPLIQQLLADIQHKENYHNVWAKIEGFVSKLDEFICWLRDALETTDNWTPPRADIDSLKLYLETHLSFKLNVDSHSALKDGLLEEGRQLLELITSHKSGLRDMLHMISHQWQELQRQIRRQHSWMLRTLDAIKTHILSSERDEEERETHSHHGSPKQVEVRQSYREAQKDVLDQMTVKLKNQQYCPNSRSVDFTLMSKSNSLSEFEAEYQELWDWLMDMESIVTDSHDLMMSEEQQHHLYKGNSVEMSMWLPKKTQLLGWSESLKRSGTELPADFDQRLTALRGKWDQLEKTLAEHVEPSVGQRSQRELLSPDTNRMVTQLESRIKELKSWLRDTELFIFNLNLRPDAQQCEGSTQDADAIKQLQHFKALCMEVRGRRKGISSVLRLCQRLLDGPEQQSSEAEHQSLQLLQVNLERRWEAIVMQVLQWQTRLKHSLGRDQVPGNLIEPSLMDLHGLAEDSWEWDEMDMTICNLETQDCEDEQNPESKSHLNSPKEPLNLTESCPNEMRCGAALSTAKSNGSSSCVYQVYSLDNVELYQQPQYNHKSFSSKVQPSLLKSLSMDSSFSSAESLPDILGDLLKGKHKLLSNSAKRSESESGIVSEGDTETTGNSELCLLFQSDDPKVCVTLTPPNTEDSLNGDRVSDEDIDRVLERANKCAEYVDSLSTGKRDQRLHIMRKKREDGGENRKNHHKEPVKILANDLELSQQANEKNLNMSRDDETVTTNQKLQKEFAQLSQGSSLDSLYAVGELFPSSKETLTRSTSLESWLAPCKSTEDAGSKESLRDIGSTVEPTGELSRRTLDLLKRLENIQSPLALKMTRSVSDVTLQSSSLWRGSRSAGAPSSINESSAASLTELSSTEDLSVASEDLAVQMNRCTAADSNASFRKHCRSQQQTDETDASISMVVNVSCTSACTDDEEDSDLLSSSTLTLTEEELGIKDDDSSVTSEEEYIEGSFTLGLDYIKDEFQSWIKPRSQSREKNEADLVDELQCGTLSRDILSPIKTTNDRQFLSRSALKLLEANTNAKNESLKQQEVDGNRRDATRSYISRFVDDMENGNVESSHVKGKDEDDELLREEGSLLTKKGESFKGSINDVKSNMLTASSPPSSCEQSLSSLEGQLKGELPCHNFRRPSPTISPVEECAHAHSRQKQLAAFLNDVHENNQESCSSESCSPPAFMCEEAKSDNVHDFVMEIIDMTSVALKTKEMQGEQPTELARSESISGVVEGCRAQISGPQTDSSSIGRSRVSSKPQVKRFTGSLATPVCKP
ncbi:A-kinase anchor protein [Pimephales promelas]|nr:A-kinase anchor protein [Pimephales promelas]